jgi:hypothetical protein
LHTKAVDDTSESEIKFNVLYIVGSILIAWIMASCLSHSIFGKSASTSNLKILDYGQ